MPKHIGYKSQKKGEGGGGGEEQEGCSATS